MAKAAKSTTVTDDGPPTSSELAAVLGGAHAVFRAMSARFSGATSEWKRYSKKAPWVLKVSDGDRTLFYVNPGRGSFDVTVVLGARATDAALGGRVSKSLHASIRAARPYAEGRPVRVVVTSEADLAGVEELVAVKLDPPAKPKRAASRKRARSGGGGPTRRWS